MPTLDDIQAEIAAIADRIDLEPTRIPSHLAELPAMEAIKKRLSELVTSIGGYEALASALPCHSAKTWQKKVEEVAHHAISVSDLTTLNGFFKDALLVALLGHEQGMQHVDLNAIPPSDYSLVDLSWALRRYQAQTQLMACELHDKTLDGEDTQAIEARISRIAKETIIVLRQMDLLMKTLRESA